MTDKASDQYQTPPAFYRGIDAEFHFDIDVAATAENRKTERFISADMDALACDWGEPGTVAWCNPPYSPGNIPKFLAKAVEQMGRGVTSVLLVPLDPGRSWTRYVIDKAAEVRAVIGRIRFLEETGEPAPSCAAKPSALIVYRPYYHGPTLYSYIERNAIEAAGKATPPKGDT